ncbi:ef-hand calcium-binding domain-containing protein 6 [Stylonychia lemnae]|uniref:Ef-hand calcium-binding domain-containing protein 6 n=1 Tax=Stylonychia lemnae TaxID=5949 RepID=A0A077ZN78_STYLE|nr:ef-hand calcium-binding domain-containing protein 6 [Stylonychia lemnae]|eukprot:CDW71437.1 ef-hand calcium-binding domain-containing protein 6 [Stylonychia lemnae]
MEIHNRNVKRMTARKDHLEESTIKINQSHLFSLCKRHFQSAIMTILRKELRNVYRGPDKAYASIDFTGIGSFNEIDFMNSMIVKKINVTPEELKDFFFLTNMFKSPMNFDSFKKIFFPHLSMIQDDGGSDQEKREKQDKSMMKTNKGKQPEIIQERLKKLEKLLKDRLSNNWDSVRKAFLGLDTDYDGYITVEDILRYFGQDNKEFIFNDLKKLIMEKDSSKQGKLGYSDFSKWVGNSIHQSEGFYFRHDSVKNPQFERNLENQGHINEMKKEISTQLMNEGLEKTIIEKIKSQWKTIRKAFIDLNKEKTGFIEAEELRFYFLHWGLTLTDAQFQFIFNKFDFDKDGKISYKDFHKSVGSEIHPGETLYFRQDKPHMMRMNKCQHNKCWQPTQGYGNFCQLHNKMYIDQGTEYFQQIFNKIGSEKWPQFIQKIKDASEVDDHRQIFFDKFCSILNQYGVTLSEHKKQLLLDTFPGRNEGERMRVNIGKLYEVRYNDKLKKIYFKIKMQETDDDDVAVDTSGYTGNFHRNVDERLLLPFDIEQLCQVIYRNNKLVDIMRAIKDIDKEHNGYVTSTELDDILKISYKKELGDKNLKSMFKPFASIQNKILIDYKRFRDHILNRFSKYKQEETDKEFSKRLKALEQQKQDIKQKILKQDRVISSISREIKHEYMGHLSKHNQSVQDAPEAEKRIGSLNGSLVRNNNTSMNSIERKDLNIDNKFEKLQTNRYYNTLETQKYMSQRELTRGGITGWVKDDFQTFNG